MNSACGIEGAIMATMYDPPHLGELIREISARRLGMGRAALSRVLNGHAGVSATLALALALERIGWSDAEHWMRDASNLRCGSRATEAGGVAVHAGADGRWIPKVTEGLSEVGTCSVISC